MKDVKRYFWHKEGMVEERPSDTDESNSWILTNDFDTMKTRLEGAVAAMTEAVNAGIAKVAQQAGEIERLQAKIDEFISEESHGEPWPPEADCR